MLNLSPTAVATLTANGCIDANQTRVIHDNVADLLSAELEANHVAGSPGDVGSVQIDVGNLTNAVFGSTDPDLIELCRAELSTGPGGRVQSRLTNGYVLCAGASSIDVTIAGQTRKVRLTTRFLSGDDATIQEYLLKTRATRFASTAAQHVQLAALVKDRQPTMAQTIDDWTTILEGTMAAAITAGP
jgi:hypothetical protein